MGHDLERMFSANRVEPWHFYETGVDGRTLVIDGTLDRHAAQIAGGLGFGVESRQVYVKETRTETRVLGRQYTYEQEVLVPGFQAIVRDDTQAVLHVATDRTVLIQNSVLYDLMEAAVDLGLEYETSGVLREGRTVFALARMPEGITVGGDQFYPFLLGATSHDGRSALRMKMTTVRVCCANTLERADGGPGPGWAVRHTASADIRIEEVKEALGLAGDQVEAFKTDAERLMNTPVTDAQYASIVSSVFPGPPPDEATDRKIERVERRRNTVKAIYYDSPTIGEFQGTGWGTVNSVNEWEIWSARSGDPSPAVEAKHQQRHMLRVVDGDYPKTRAAGLLVASLS